VAAEDGPWFTAAAASGLHLAVDYDSTDRATVDHTTWSAARPLPALDPAGGQ
jgi:hypothetical protein